MGKFKEFLNEKNIKVFYHNDMDGYGSAYAIWKNHGDNVKYISIDHGDIPDIKKDDIIYMVDFSLSRQKILKYLKIAKNIIIIDHHQTAQAALEQDDNPENLEVTFDMSKSGAVLTWEYFNKEKVPKMLKHIQDCDLWAWKLEHSEEFGAWFKKNIFVPKDKTFRDLDNLPDLEKIYNEGAKLVKIENEKVKEALKTKYEVQFEGYTIGIVNSSENASKIGNALAKEYKFGVVKSINKKNEKVYLYQLRSIGNFDVSNIAKKYQGGGHKNAAGFEQPKEKEIWKVL